MNTIDPGQLKLHPLLLELPGAPESYKTGAHFDTLCDHLLATGAPLTPLPVVGHQVCTPDAARMMFAARQCSILALPVFEVPPDEAALVISEMCLHLHYTKGQQAYLLWPIVKEMIAKTRIHQEKNRQKGRFPTGVHSVNTGDLTVEEFAHRLGMSRTMFHQAREVYALFAKDPKYKAAIEPVLLRAADKDTPGLGAIIAGHDGFKKTGSTRPEVNQFELFDGFFGKVFKHGLESKELRLSLSNRLARADNDQFGQIETLHAVLGEELKAARAARREAAAA